MTHPLAERVQNPSPPIRPYGADALHAPTGSEAAAFDRHAIDELGVPQAVLMENAGRGAAAVLDRLYPRGLVIGVIGAGNNGGDALVLLRTLAASGRSVRAILAADRPENDPLLHRWPVPLLDDARLRDDPAAYDGALAGAAVLVDGVLGTGLEGPPRPRQEAAILAMNRCGAPVLSLDVPSGTDSDGGTVPGAAVTAEVTVAFGWPKLGSLLHPARRYAGRIVAVEIGFPPVDRSPLSFAATVVTPGWSDHRRPGRKLVTHKNEVGSLLLLAGSAGMAGAAILAARAALRSGVGLVRIASSPENREVIQATLPEAIFIDAEDSREVARARDASRAVAAGPGLGTGDAAAAALAHLLEEPAGEEGVPLLLDADALNLIASGRTPMLEDIARRRPVLITPHVGEMARISGSSVDEIGQDRPEAARRAAGRFGCVVLLKGTPSLVGAPESPLLVDSVGTSDLAAAGMGDVLTGVAAGFLAQGCSPRTAAGLALYHTGRAAVLAGKGASLLPSDVVERLADALLEEGKGESDLHLPFLLFDQDTPR